MPRLVFNRGEEYQSDLLKKESGKKITKNSMGTLKRLSKYLISERLYFIAAMFIIIIDTYLMIITPFLMGQIIDNYIINKDLSGLRIGVLLLAVRYVISSLTTWLSRYIMVNISQNVILKLRTELFGKLQKLSIRYFDTHSHGNIISRITNDVDSISMSLSNSVVTFMSAVFSIIGVLYAMLRVNWRLSMVTILFSPVILITAIPLAKISRRAFLQRQRNLGVVNGIVEETVSGQKEIQSFAKEDSIFSSFLEKNIALKKIIIKSEIFSGFMQPVNSFISHLRFALIATIGGLLTLKNLSSVGQIITFISYSKQFSNPINELASVYNSIQLSLAGAERIFEIIDVDDEFIDSDEAEEDFRIGGKIEFRNTSFGYIKNTPVIKNMNLVINAGEKIALVGATGSGKTTIANLLMRFYDVTEGEILIDDININNYKKYSLRKNIGIVLQDSYLFSGTIKDNIRYGKLTATDEEIYEAAKMAMANNFIRRLPQGYNTPVKEGGKNLSSGQKQLISIARTILADRDILILDEATSSVDTRTEFLLQKAMINLMKNRTTFVIAHRLSTIRDADRIIVISNGEIAETGNHEDLVSKKGLYYNLYTMQFKGHTI